MDRRKSIRTVGFVYGGYVLRYLYLIIVVPFYSRTLGVDGYSRVLASMSLMSVIWMLVAYGFEPVGMRDISKAQTTEECNEILSLHLSARLVHAIVGGCAGLVATMCSPVLSQTPLIGVMATLLGIVSGANLGWLFQGRHQFRTPIIIEVFGFALSLVLVLSIVRGPRDAVWVVASLLISGVASSVISYGLAISQLGWPRLRWTGTISLIRKSTMLFIYSSASRVLTASSTYLLTLLSTPAQVGYFGAAERFAALSLGLMGPAAQVFIPTITRQLAHGDKDGANQTTRRGAMLLIGYGLLVCCAALTLSPLVLPLILGDSFAHSAHILQIFALMFPFAAFNEFIAGYVFLPRKKDRLLATVGIASAFVNIILALVLAPHYGAVGLAFARVIGETTLSAMLMVIMIRLRLVLLIPGCERALMIIRNACGIRDPLTAPKDK
ncbi:oligosaccharide flippase family protein [Paraburkholderia strydomiana]|uniref:oligosaccharide flippase family protein n=1 Tax=Paraburkholderia strydomiana TaxID=1245417 RepID=UPI0038BDECF6